MAEYPLVDFFFFLFNHVQTNPDKRGLPVQGVAMYCRILSLVFIVPLGPKSSTLTLKLILPMFVDIKVNLVHIHPVM